MFEKVVEMIAEQLNINAAEITEDSRLSEDLGADSIDVVSMIMDCESEFGVTIDDDALPQIKTVGDIVRYIEAKK